MEAFAFLLVGTINTLIGFSAYVLLLKILNPNLANAISYVITLYIAYFLYKYFVFTGRTKERPSKLLFVFSFIIAFLANQAVLSGALAFSFDPVWAQIMAMASYTVINYAFNKAFAFR